MYEKIKLSRSKNNQTPILLILTIIFFILLLFYFINSKTTYSVKTLVGEVECDEECIIKSLLNYEDTSLIDQELYIEYENNRYKVNEIHAVNTEVLDNNAFEEIELKTDLKTKNKIIKYKILYSHKRIIQKIIDSAKKG